MPYTAMTPGDRRRPLGRPTSLQQASLLPPRSSRLCPSDCKLLNCSEPGRPPSLPQGPPGRMKEIKALESA